MAVARTVRIVGEEEYIMPKAIALRRARRDARQGKKPNTQAGEFVREEMKAYKHVRKVAGRDARPTRRI